MSFARRGLQLGVLSAVLGASLANFIAPSGAALAVPTAGECLARPLSQQVVTGAQTFTSTYGAGNVADNTTFDFRGTSFRMDQDSTSSTYNKSGAVIGAKTLPAGLCVVGGIFAGQQSRDLDWEYLKRTPGGGDFPALRTSGVGPTHVDGVRVDNVMNALRPVVGSHTVSNVYARYIRDDCLANDDLVDVKITDSLFDGCYVGFSLRPDSGSPLYSLPRDTSTLEIDGVLVRMQAMPGGHGYIDPDPSVKHHDHLWKWSDVTGSAVIRNSIIMAEDPSASLAWPRNVTAEDVTIVWTGPGDYPGTLPASGVTVTTDISVWDQARAKWLARHGCTSFDACDPAKMINPDPLVDVVAPTTTVTSPVGGVVVSGSTTITAAASDDVGVARVDFYDGATLVGSDDTSPYSVAWATTAVANGAHQLTAQAFDATGNTSVSAPVDVTVKNMVTVTVTVTAAADTFVRERSMLKNFGDLAEMRVRDASDGNDMRSYLRFDVPAIDEPATAKLRLYVVEASTDGGRVYATSSSWDERRLTWKNQPGPMGPPLAAVGPAAAGRWVEVDLGTVIAGAGSYSFMVADGLADRAVYASRESATPPELVVTTGV